MNNINSTIKSYINDFAENNEISYKKALERLTNKQLELFKWTLEDYIKEAQKDPYNRQVINSSIKARLSRLEALKIQIGYELNKMYSDMERTTERVLSDVAKDSYYKTLYNTDGTEFHILDDKTIKSFTKRKWVGDGLNYSQRIWNDRKKLANTLEKGIMEHLVTGGDINKVINNLTGFVNEKVYNRRAVSARLVYTEMSAVRSTATQEAYGELGVEKYKILATLDNRTSQICRNMDGKVFDKKEYQVGVTAPPFHCNCRSTTVPYFDDEDTEGERVARGEDNKQYNIPSKMTYDEWYKEYVLKEEYKSGIIEEKDSILEGLDKKLPRKKFAEKLLSNLKLEHLNVSVKKIDARGSCGLNLEVLDSKSSKLTIKTYNLQKDDDRKRYYQLKTIFHEAYHALGHNKVVDFVSVNYDFKNWAYIDDVFAECSAHYMMRKMGNKVPISPSYPKYLSETLPKLKKLEKFKKCKTLEDFGEIAWKDRMNGLNPNWITLRKELENIEIDKSYYDTYLEYARKNRSKIYTLIKRNSPSIPDKIIQTILDNTLNKNEREEQSFYLIITNAMRLKGVK